MNADFKKTLWDTANKLRGAVDPADYKYPVLGLIFLKYVSDAFENQREILLANIADPQHPDYEEDEDSRLEELEIRDNYTENNIFWVPEKARWSFIQANAKQPDIATKLDEAMTLIEKDNPKLSGLLPKVYVRTHLEANTIGSLIDLVATIEFGKGEHAGDILGDVYEYFLGNFAGSEGKNAGEFYTTKPIVKVLVEVMAPTKGRIYDPACGAGGMFVSSGKFTAGHGGKVSDMSIYGQERNPATWRLAAMNLTIRGLEFNLGKANGDTFTNDQHPGLKADYVLMNPPFGQNTEWSKDKLESDPRWVYGIPPAKPANYAWMQHALSKLSAQGQAGIVMPNGTLTTSSGGEDSIRQKMVEADVVEVIVAMPGQLFLNTGIPCCLWFLTKDKTKHGRARKGEVLFIDARKLGYMVNRVNRDLSDEDVQKIAQTVHLWRQSEHVLPVAEGTEAPVYQDIPGFCKSATFKEIQEKGFVLSPGRYCGSEEVDDDDEAFAERMDGLVGQLKDLFAKSDELRVQVKAGLKELGYEL